MASRAAFVTVLVAFGLFVIGWGVLTWFVPSDDPANRGLAVLFVSYGAALLFAAVRARRLKAAAAMAWATATESSREILLVGLLVAIVVTIDLAVPDLDGGVSEALNEIANTSIGLLGVGSWMLLLGPGWTAYDNARDMSASERPLLSRTGAGWSLMALATLDLGGLLIWTYGWETETPAMFVVLEANAAMAILFGTLMFTSAVVGLALLGVGTVSAAEEVELTPVPRQLLIVNAALIVLWGYIIYFLPAEANTGFAVSYQVFFILAGATIYGVAGQFFTAWSKARSTA